MILFFTTVFSEVVLKYPVRIIIQNHRNYNNFFTRKTDCRQTICSDEENSPHEHKGKRVLCAQASH